MQETLTKSIDYLKKGKIILYPTDTVWGLGCDATNENAIKKIYTLKKREDSKALICLVKDKDMLKKYIEDIPEKAFEYLDKTDKPTSIIYPKAKNLAQNLIAKDGSIAIRICQTEFCKQLINTFSKPIVSTSANISGFPTPQNFKEIQPEILNTVDYIVNLYDNTLNQIPSRIIKFNTHGNPITIRE